MRVPSVAFYLALLFFAHMFSVKLLLVLVFVLAFAVSVGWRFATRYLAPLQDVPSNGAVFITGASSGIGRSLALDFAKRGFVVFAGVRKQGDGDKLAREAQKGSIVPVICDVTLRQSVGDAAVSVRKELEKRNINGLFGVYSNAGIMLFSPIETMDDRTSRSTFEVNYFGAVSVVQAFAPLLRDYTSANPDKWAHIGLVSSVAGFFSSAGGSPYAASKFALEALGDSLRGELRPYRIHTTLYEFGAVVSSIAEASDSVQLDANGRYFALEKAYRNVIADFRKSCAPTQLVVDEIVHNSFSKFPGARVASGMPLGVLPAFVLAALPDNIRDLVMSFVLKW